MDHPPRFAVYFAPDPSSALWAFGCSVLGRDAESDRDTALLPPLTAHLPDWSRKVAAAAHYGFHATLKAPFELATGKDEHSLRDAVATLSRGLTPVALGRLQVATIGRFIALVPAVAPAPLEQLAGQVVTALDAFRAPLSEHDRRRRQPEALTPRQREHLDRWGYPYVLDQFRFHMTLTGPLEDDERGRVLQLLSSLYRPQDGPVTIDQICIFMQCRRDLPFRLAHRLRLGG
ncbi:MAG: DUF1045 domain-containing protein [Hyphomicrobiaceae bacterium]